jgi:hypothetical protein
VTSDGQVATPAEFLARFRITSNRGRVYGQHSARCPNVAGHEHGDRDPSLSIHIAEDDVIGLTCHAGCETIDVLATVGLTLRDLFTVSCRDKPRVTFGKRRRWRTS